MAPAGALTPPGSGQRYQASMQLADLVFAAVLGGFFALSWGFVRLCEHLGPGEPVGSASQPGPSSPNGVRA